MPRSIPLNEPIIGELEEELVLEALRSGRLVKGPMVARFEQSVREAVGARFAVAVNSGTSAIMLALLAHGIGPGDEVVTSPFTFVATLNAILQVGAAPRFADIGDDYNLDPDAVADHVTGATKAIVPVHLYGSPADVGSIRRAAGRPDIVIVDDAAQALGAHRDGRPVGSSGTACFSFYASKNVTTAEGGVVTTDDEAVARAVRVLADQGQAGMYEYVRPGFNMRLSELHAALGVAQMTRLTTFVEARRANARALQAGLSGVDGLVLPREPENCRHVFQQFTVRCTEDAPVTRDRLAAQLREAGIACGVYYPRPVFAYACFERDPRVGRPSAPKAETASRQVLSLPVQPSLTASDRRAIVEVTRRALARRVV